MSRNSDIGADKRSQQESTLAHTIREADFAGAWNGDLTPLGGTGDEIPFPVNAHDVLDIVVGVEPVMEDKCLVLYHMIFQQVPECGDGKLVVWIQLIEKLLPRHEHQF